MSQYSLSLMLQTSLRFSILKSPKVSNMFIYYNDLQTMDTCTASYSLKAAKRTQKQRVKRKQHKGGHRTGRQNGRAMYISRPVIPLPPSQFAFIFWIQNEHANYV